MDAGGPSQSQLNRILLGQITDTWTILILTVLCQSGGKARFNEIKRGIPGIPQGSLARALQQSERNGLVERKVLDANPRRTTYVITHVGHSLEKQFAALQIWAKTHQAAMAAAQARFDRQ